MGGHPVSEQRKFPDLLQNTISQIFKLFYYFYSNVLSKRYTDFQNYLTNMCTDRTIMRRSPAEQRIPEVTTNVQKGSKNLFSNT